MSAQIVKSPKLFYSVAAGTSRLLKVDVSIVNPRKIISIWPIWSLAFHRISLIDSSVIWKVLWLAAVPAAKAGRAKKPVISSHLAHLTVGSRDWFYKSCWVLKSNFLGRSQNHWGVGKILWVKGPPASPPRNLHWLSFYFKISPNFYQWKNNYQVLNRLSSSSSSLYSLALD